jgi:hypothetical protein
MRCHVLCSTGPHPPTDVDSNAATCPPAPVHTKTLMACLELGRTLSRKVNSDAFHFKAIKGS